MSNIAMKTMKNMKTMKKLPHLLPFTILLLTAIVARGALIDGVVSYWPLDALNAATTPDAATTFANPGNPLTVVGSPTLGTGQFSNAMTFSAGQYLWLANPAAPGSFNGGNGFRPDTQGLPS